MTIFDYTISHDTLTIVVGVIALIMVVREVLKTLFLAASVSKFGAIRFRLSYWLHLWATVGLTVAFVLLYTDRI